MRKGKIAVIGGGVAGMMAAITAARLQMDVTIFESTNRVGNKLLLTGNGKCNFSNVYLEDSCYYCRDYALLKKTFDKFSPKDAEQFFMDSGMLIKNKNGYLYPQGEQASIVLDILRIQLKKENVTIITEAKVKKITKENPDFIIEIENGNTYTFDKVILTTGGRSYPKTGSDGSGYKLAKKLGHTVFPTVPALVQLVGKDDFYKIVAGVRSEGVVCLKIDEQEIRKEFGEIQFTDYGISGIPIFQLSRMASYGLFDKKNVQIIVDVLPDIHNLKEFVDMRHALHKENTLEEFMCGIANKKLCILAIKLNHLNPNTKVDTLTKQQLMNVVTTLKHIVFHITDTKSYDTAQVTAGGVLLSEISEDFSSKITEKLYFAGEILDVDGICGGYNLHWAFASGFVAGHAAAGEKL